MNRLKNTFTVIAVTFLLINIFGSIPSAKADTVRAAGVKAGDWAKYAFSYNYTTNDTSMGPNPYFNPPFIDLEYYRMEIQSVVGTNLTYQVIMHYRNGTETKMYSWIDVSTGMVNYGSLTGYGAIVAANLTAGDKVYLNQFAPTLNTTETGIYAGSQRVVNRLRIDQSSNYPYSSQSLLMDVDFRWDQMSGIFVAFNENLTAIDTNKGYVTRLEISLIITETSVWKPALVIAADVLILPRVLKLQSDGKWIIAFIQLPDQVKAREVDPSTITINGTIHTTGKPIIMGKKWLLAKFDRSDVASFILGKDYAGRRFRVVMLTITGKLRDGSLFSGSDKIIIVQPHEHHWRLYNSLFPQ